MVLDHTENFVSSDADADIATGDTSISVADASVYPDPASVGAYNVVVDDSEVVRLTALDTGTNTLTVTRAQEGTTAQAFTAPVPVELNATRKVFRDTDSALDSVASYSGTPPTADNLTSQLGTSSNRQDVYAGAIDGQSIFNETDILVVGGGGSLIQRLDATATTTPVSDALSIISSAGGGGEILLPTGVTQNDGAVTITPAHGPVTIRGRGGRDDSNDAGSTLHIPTSGTDGIVIDSSSGAVRGWQLLDFDLRGPGIGAAAQSTAIKFTGGSDINNWEIRGSISDWYGEAIHSTGPKPYQFHVGPLFVYNVDAGDSSGVFAFNVGPGSRFGQTTVYPRQTSSASTSNIWSVNGNSTSFVIEQADIGGSTNAVIFTNCSLEMGPVNYEPNAVNGSAYAVVGLNTDSPCHVGPITINGAQVDPNPQNPIELAGADPSNKHIEMVKTVNGATIQRGPVVVQSDMTTKGSKYEGPISGVFNNTGSSLTEPVYCWDGNVT